MADALVSIIMNCRNCEEYLREALESARAQTYANWEIIFYDNLSSDGSAAIAQNFDPRLRYIRGEAPLSLGAARNRALAAANGEFVAFLDCDDMWLPGKLASQIEVFKADPAADFVYGNYYFLQKKSGAWQRKLGLKGKPPEGNVFAAFLKHYPVNLQTVMLRRSALTSLGEWFDETLNLSEEYDLFMRLLYSARARYLEQPLACYRVHDRMSSILQMAGYPDEVSRVLEKLKSAIPGFETSYFWEVRYLEAKIGYWCARAEMYAGNRHKAREYLRPHMFKGAPFLPLYGLTFLPAWVWHRIGLLPAHETSKA